MASRSLALAVLVLAFAATAVYGDPAGSDFTISPDPPAEDEQVTFTFVPGPSVVGTPTVAWDIVGNATFEKSGTSATHTYGDGGSKTVRMRVTDAEGSSIVEKRVTVQDGPNSPPTVGFSFSPTSPLPGQTVNFAGTGSDPDGDRLSYSWTFGDGSSSTAEDPAHAYASPGTRTVAVTVSDGRGGSDTETKQITVQNRKPIVDFSFQPVSPLPGETVLFSPDVSDPDGDAVTLSWSFGTGSTMTGTNTATYATPGTRTVTLTATDSRGGRTTETRQLTVRDPSGPNAAVTVSAAVPLVGQPVTLTSTSTATVGSITSMTWDLDDDGEYDDAVGSPISRSFATPGNHDVWLQVTQTNGTSDVEKVTIRVNSPPSAGFVWSPTAPVARQAIDLFSVSGDAEGALSAQAWDLDGDGAYDDATGASVRHSFGIAGTHDVGIQVTDSDGAVSTLRRAITVAPAAQSAAQVRFMTPFPIVRLAGKVLRRSADVDRLAVRAPRGASVRVTCTGAGCPVRVMRKVSQGRTLRFKAFERTLRAGIRLGIFVRQRGMIGKYTGFRIRAAAPPARTDRCLYPGVTRPRRCP